MLDKGEPVTIQYITTPEAYTDYKAYMPCFNTLIFNESNHITTAHDPYPENNDIHAICDDNSYQLKWTVSEMAVKHHLMMSNDSVNFKEIAALTDTTYLMKGPTNLLTYYCKIDEEATDGIRELNGDKTVRVYKIQLK